MRSITSLVLAGVFFSIHTSFASEEDDLARMQKQLNSEVMSQPFLAEEPARVDAYIREATRQGIKPEVYKGPHWRPGYTCHDMLRWSWVEYRNCRYYHSYYGSYYPY